MMTLNVATLNRVETTTTDVTKEGTILFSLAIMETRTAAGIAASRIPDALSSAPRLKGLTMIQASSGVTIKRRPAPKKNIAVQLNPALFT